MKIPFHKKQSVFFITYFLQIFLFSSFSLASTTLLENDFRNAFSELVTRNNIFPPENVEINNFSCAPCQLTVSDGLVDYLIISQAKGSQLGKETITVDVLVNSEPQGRVKLSGDIHLYGEVVCAAHAVKRHSILEADDLVTIRRDISMLGPDFIDNTNLAIGTELKTTLRPGAIIYKRFLVKPKVVRRGDVVSIMAQTKQLKVRVPGRIESAGAVGDIIRVKNLMSRKEIYARVVNAEEVLVDF